MEKNGILVSLDEKRNPGKKEKSACWFCLFFFFCVLVCKHYMA